MPKVLGKRTRHPGVYRNGDQWWIQVTKVTPDGQRLYRTKALPGELQIEEVVKARAELAADLAAEVAGRAVVALPSNLLTVAGFAVRWMVLKRKRLKPSSVERYEFTIGNRLLPTLGRREAASITRTDAEELVAHLEGLRRPDGTPYTEDTIRGWWRAISTLLRDMAAEVGTADPTARVAPPRSTARGRRESRTLTADQVRALLKAVETKHPTWLAEVAVAAVTGVRSGELHALTWQDVGETGLTVRRSVYKGKVTETKSRKPRHVPIPPPVAAILKKHRETQNPPSSLVFPAEGDKHRYTTALAKVLRQSAEAAGIDQRVTPQVLRRTVNTLLVEAGVPGPVLRSILGHSSERMTDLYAGIHPEAQHNAAAPLGALVPPSADVGPAVLDPSGGGDN